MTAPQQANLASGGAVERWKCVECLMVDGVRYEAHGAVPVRVCFACGFETPPLAACCERREPSSAEPIPERLCGWCQVPLTLKYPTDPRRFCSRLHVDLSRTLPLIDAVCRCGAAFQVHPAIVAHAAKNGLRRGIYCSTTCQHRFRLRAGVA